MHQITQADSSPTVSLTAELSALRRARIDEILAGRLIGSVSGKRALFIHVLPLGGIDDVLALTPHSDRLRTLVPPIGASSWDYRFNADGYLVHAANWRGDGIPAFVQWLRCGGVEVFSGDLVVERSDGSPVTVPTLYSHILAAYLRTHLPTAVNGLRDLLGVERSLTVSTVLMGMKDVRFAESHHGWPSRFEIGREVVTTPWLVMARGADPSLAISAMGDVLWQSAGMSAMPPLGTP